MTIAIDVRHGGQGGIPYYVRSLVEGLVASDDGDTYLLVHTSWRKPHPYADLVSKNPRVHCVNLGIPNKLLNGAVVLGRWPYFDDVVYWRTGQRVDLVLAPNLHFFAVSSRVKLVTVVHDIAFVLLPYHLGWRQRWWHCMVGARRLLQRSDRVIAVSGQTADDVVRHFELVREKVRVGGEGFEQMRGDGDTVSRIDTPYLLMMGVRDERKNWQAAIEALAMVVREQPKFADLRLVVVGSGEVRRRAVVLACELGLRSGQIEWYESVTSDQRRSLYAGAAALLYSSVYEGFGLPPLEALSLGVPVIAPVNSAVGEVVEGGVVLVDPMSTRSIADGIVAVLTDNTLRSRMLARADEITARHTWSSTVQRVRAVLSELAC